MTGKAGLVLGYNCLSAIEFDVIPSRADGTATSGEALTSHLRIAARDGRKRGAPVARSFAACVAQGDSLLMTDNYITMPPSTASTCPVIYFASAEARYATAAAISSGCPSLPRGIFCKMA
jgi:hypothetical protein